LSRSSRCRAIKKRTGADIPTEWPKIAKLRRFSQIIGG
jgi:hypothetical protein